MGGVTVHVAADLEFSLNAIGMAMIRGALGGGIQDTSFT